ncbi:hypothetical protein OH76DRAFT_1396833 [Lentinus brumalis]|uniref:Actin cytoskeleton-regulatory complex protein SLA1 n=1 Tax=Lentinus brumalis TaxID=2498619 RepID=A0A371DSF3_9APHY|nr:hypothetical protein OH76DRAFT_1396833 [Polyporus brumalis]
MSAEPDKYLAVLRASYDYEPQADAVDEIALKENQLLFLLERTDEDWWKVKIKPDSQEEDSPSGLVPSAYVELAEPIQVVKVLYDYDAAEPTELTVKEDEILDVYVQEEDWLLVSSRSEEGKIGYVPGNYVEETDGEGEAPAGAPAAASISSIVVPDSPPQPARPVSTYVDPADRVAAASNKAQADSIKTWSISEIDAKGKKKKGTLGIGNGAMFFASESDKNPVRKWQTSDIQSVKLEKSKHVHIEVGGADAASLHYHAGSKDTAEEILAKLESSRAIANGGVPATNGTASPPPAEEPPIERPRSSAQKSVHFAQDEPEEIPAEPYEEEQEEEQPHVAPEEDQPVPSDGAGAIALYDFTADGEDELSVHEGEGLVVLERDSEEWWKVRNARGEEGVVPASYVELVGGEVAVQAAPSAPVRAAEGAAAAAAAQKAAQEAAAREEEEEERRTSVERERAEKERKKQEAEQRAKAAAAAAEADRKRREQKQKEKERAIAEEEARRKKQAEKKSEEKSRSSSDSKRGPPPETLREWRDRTGQFRVDAAFLGFANGKLRLHKVNGVVIEVPAEKMSEEDLRYVQKITGKHKNGSSSRRRSDDDDNEPLELRRKSMIEAKATTPPKAPPQPKPKGPTIDWFEFFLNAGCDVDDCTRYESSFQRDKIDEAVLPDITEETMRRLGLREGDIIRVKKAIEQRKPKSGDREDQLRKDEELARQLQAEDSNLKSRSPAPNLFAGSNGELKNMRRGRPQTNKSVPNSVDLQSISTASDQIKRTGSPMVASPDGIQQLSSSPAQLPPKTTPSGFDDDAWTNRPSSTKPVAPTPPARAPSAPPAPPAPPAAPSAPTVAVSPPPARAASVASGAPAQQSEPAKSADDDIFNQLARIASMRVSSPAASQPAPAVAPSVIPQRAPSASISPPIAAPIGFATGMGMGSSPVPMGQALQAQQTGMFAPSPGPRGPFAPVPANQSLLQPLVPTTTGFSGFVPTRPGASSSPFSSQPPQQPSMYPQQTGFMGAAPPVMSQPTGFQPQGIMSQPIGMPNGNFGNFGGGMQSMPSFQATPSFNPVQTNPTGFNPIQSNPTGFNPGYGQSPFGGNGYSATPPPPAPPLPSQSSVNTNPANIFAQMKSGTFAQDEPGPQGAEKYDALRPNPTPLTVQSTGWGGYGGGMNGFQGGYGYQ